MKRIISAVTLAAFVVVCVVVAVAQAPARVVNGGVLNGKAVSLPKPIYPEAARIAGISGVIAVNILIDEAGTVISAEADPYDQRQVSDGAKHDPVEADASLRAAAENAARQARFSPTLLSGNPVQVKGRILYNFVADKADSPAIVKHENTGASAEQLVKLAEVPGTPNGGVLNGRALELPAPSYPAAAKAVRAEGTVSVKVLIDESGAVAAAAAVSGHPLLRAAAEKAAREARFDPTYLNGVAIKVSGVVTYNFVLPKKEDPQR